MSSTSICLKRSLKVIFFQKNKFHIETNYLEQLYNLTKDHDSLVVINAIEAINEVKGDKGGIEVNRQLVINLLNRIKDFNEWG